MARCAGTEFGVVIIVCLGCSLFLDGLLDRRLGCVVGIFVGGTGGPAQLFAIDT